MSHFEQKVVTDKIEKRSSSNQSFLMISLIRWMEYFRFWVISDHDSTIFIPYITALILHRVKRCSNVTTPKLNCENQFIQLDIDMIDDISS